MNRNLKRLIRKKGRCFKKAKKSGMDEDRARYLDIEQMVKCELRDAKRVYVNGILQNGLESGNNKPFWKYVSSQKQVTFGISALKSNGNVITDSLSQAEILYSQFNSVFTPQSGNTFPQLQFPNCTAKYLNLHENWSNTWGMRFNAVKCNIMRLSRTCDPRLFNYSLTGQVQEEVMDAKCLGATLSNGFFVLQND